MKPCPRMPAGHKPIGRHPAIPDDGSCDYCGSLDPGVFMARLEAGDIVLTPTDKDYKVYVKNDGGQPFRQSHGERIKEVDPACGHEVEKTVGHIRDVEQTKFYFYHLDEAQRRRFVELLNAKRLKLDFPGHFYRLPFFVQ